MIAGYQAQLTELRNKIQKDQKKIGKLEQKLSIAAKGYFVKMSKLVAGSDAANSAVTQLQHGSIELDCFRKLYEQEHGWNVPKRLAEAKAFTIEAEVIEAALQKQYEAKTAAATLGQ